MRFLQLAVGLAAGIVLGLAFLWGRTSDIPPEPTAAGTLHYVSPTASAPPQPALAAQSAPDLPPATADVGGGGDEAARLRAELATLRTRFLRFADAASVRQTELEAATLRLRYDLAMARHVPVESIPIPDMSDEVRTNEDAARRLAQLEQENRRSVDGYAPERSVPRRVVSAASAPPSESTPRGYERPREREPVEPPHQKGFFESLRDAFTPGTPPKKPYDFVHGE